MKVDKETSAAYDHLFKQAAKFMLGKEKKDERKTWSTPQKKTWILRKPHCPICEQKLTVKSVSREHIFPLVLGGRESDDNIIPLCEPCNKNRNDLMTICIGSNNLATLRKRWPANKTSIEEFLVWCHATISQDRETVEQFSHLNETFSKLRSIKNKYALKTSKPQKSLFARGKDWLQNRRKNVSKKPSKTEEVRITCIGENCKESFTMPEDYEGEIECPRCGLNGHYSSTELTFESPKVIVPSTPVPASETIVQKSETKKEDKKEQKSKFNLDLWLKRNWKGLESAPSTYVELKLAISAHEKMNQKRAVRMVLHEDCGLPKNLVLAKMFQRLDELSNSGKKEKVSIPKKITQPVPEQGKYNLIPNLNSASKGLRFPKEPKDFAASLEWFVENFATFQSFKECLESLKVAGIITKSRSGTTLKPILRGFSSDGSFESISEQSLSEDKTIVLKRILEDLRTRTAHVEYILDKEEFMQELGKYLHAVNEAFTEKEEWDFKSVIIQLIRDGATDSQKLGMSIIQYQTTNNWTETGKEAFNGKSGIGKSKSYISTIREYMGDAIEIEGDGPAYRFTLRE